MIIALMGNDGSGKTTIAKRLVRVFNDLGFKVIYKHEYDYVILKFLFNIIGRDNLDQERKKMIVEREKSWKYYLWPFLVCFDVFLQYLYFKIFRRKAIIILDRYLYDHYISFEYLRSLTRLSEWLYRYFPKPDISFVLWAEPKIAYLRKKSMHNYRMSFYVEQTKRYLQLARSLGIKTINTNKSVRETINEIFMALPKDKLALIFEKGMQNKVLFSVVERYGITSADPAILRNLQDRKKKLEKTFAFVKEFFEENGIIKYCIVKTLCSDAWIGNDVDILVPDGEFSKIVAGLRELNTSHVKLRQKIVYKGKIDIKLLVGLPIDLHKYIGWRNVGFIPFEAILKKDYLFKRSGLYFANEKVNSIIIILTHVFEKGFITLDEYNFLTNHFDETFMETNFHMHILLSDYISWTKKTLKEKRSHSYPIFIPMHIIIKCHSKLLFDSKNANSNLFWKINAFIRDISFMIFWRIRYRIKNKLPFEVK